MKFTKVTDVDGFMSSLDPKDRKIVEPIRRLVRKSIPGVEEVIKWNTLAYQMDGKTVGTMMVHKEHVNLQFWRGAELTDKRGLLIGEGKGMRHVKFYAPKEVENPDLGRLLEKAGRLK